MSERVLCGEPAQYRFTWPGQDESFICGEHAPQLVGVASAIGCHVQLIPVHESDQAHETCRQKVKS